MGIGGDEMGSVWGCVCGYVGEVMYVLIILILIIIPPSMYISNNHIVHIKYIQYLAIILQ